LAEAKFASRGHAAVPRGRAIVARQDSEEAGARQHTDGGKGQEEGEGHNEDSAIHFFLVPRRKRDGGRDPENNTHFLHRFCAHGKKISINGSSLYKWIMAYFQFSSVQYEMKLRIMEP